MAREVVVGVELADDLGDLVRAVEPERDRRVLRSSPRPRRRSSRRTRAAGRRRRRPSRSRSRSLSALEELQRRERVVLVVGERVGHRALVAVVGRQVEDVVEVVGQAGEHRVVGDRALDEARRAASSGTFSRSAESRLSTTSTSRRVAREQRAHEVRADEPGAADDEDPRCRRARLTARTAARLDLQVGEGLARCRARGSTRSRARDALLERRLRLPARSPAACGDGSSRIVKASSSAARRAPRPRSSSSMLERLDGGVEELLDRVVRAGRDVVGAAGPVPSSACTTTSIRSST